jgi:hypothetical protein
MGKRDVGPTYEFAASSEVGPGATIGTLHTGYPRVQASSQDKEWGMHPRATMCLVVLDPTSLIGWAPVLPCVLGSRPRPLLGRAPKLSRVS